MIKQVIGYRLEVIVVACCLLLVALFAPLPAFAADPVRSQSLLDFDLQIPIPGVSIAYANLKNGTAIANYVSGIYLFLVSISAILAVMMIVWGGVVWLTAGGNQSRVGEAQKIIINSIAGLVLALGSVVFLNAINPELIQLKVVKPRGIDGLLLENVAQSRNENIMPYDIYSSSIKSCDEIPNPTAAPPPSGSQNCSDVCKEIAKGKGVNIAVDNAVGVQKEGKPIEKCCCSLSFRRINESCGAGEGCAWNQYCDPKTTSCQEDSGEKGICCYNTFEENTYIGRVRKGQSEKDTTATSCAANAHADGLKIDGKIIFCPGATDPAVSCGPHGAVGGNYEHAYLINASTCARKKEMN